ncbi:MAG: sensor histidine kinase [Actinomycetia bacterium]|nr:sensor histidine kinase [Actinomycetes bacterium]
MRRLLTVLVGSGRAGDRPWVFTLLFWSGLVLPWVARWAASDDSLLLPAPWLAAVTALLLALWPWLGWSPDGGNSVMSLGFVAAGIFHTVVDGTGYGASILLIALAGVVLVAGVRVAALAAGVLVATMGVTLPLVYHQSWQNVVRQVVGIAPLVFITLAVTQLIAAERQRRATAARLLADLEKAHDDLARSHTDLAEAHAELQRRSEETRLLAVAEERARLAREVHDAVGHHLTVIRLGLTNALRYREVDPEAAWAEVADARAGAGTALDEVRRAVRAMGPAPLAEQSLGTALQTLAGTYRGNGLEVSFGTSGAARVLPPDISATLYRVAEETLTNVHRHAERATRADVTLTFDPGSVTLSVGDDGRPCPPVQPGFGLAGAKQRLAEAGGELVIEQPPAGGVRVLARVLERVTG